MYDIDRKSASRLLKVSIRTVDRYIVSKRLSVERRDGRIWLDKKQVLSLKSRRNVDSRAFVSSGRLSMDDGDLLSVDMSMDGQGDDIAKSQINASDVYSQGYTHRQRSSGDSEVENKPDQSSNFVYKKLFEELQLEIKNYRDRLEMANYRVGQLEANLKETVPLLEYNRNLEQLKSEQEQIHRNFDSQSDELNQARISLKDERFNKKVYLIILFILLLLQPLWFIFPMQ